MKVSCHKNYIEDAKLSIQQLRPNTVKAAFITFILFFLPDSSIII